MLEKLLEKYSVDGILISSRDEFLNEYVAQERSLMYFLSGFNGSNGIIFVGRNYNILFTDGRYLAQAAIQLDMQKWKIVDLGAASIENILYSMEISSIAVLSNYFSQREIADLGANFRTILLGKMEVFQSCNFAIPKTFSEVFEHEIEYAGEESAEKISKIRQEISGDCYFISDAASICWLLNIRGADVPCSPLINAFAIIEKRSNTVKVFGNFNNPPAHSGADFQDFSQLERYLSKISSISLTKKEVNGAIYNAISEYCGEIIDVHNPILLPKSIKNSVEIQGMRSAHKIDGIAVKKLLNWVKNTDNISEYDISQKAIEFRSESLEFIYPSFETIAGFNENGAIIHYKPEQISAKNIEKTGVLLIDSGGQYLCGTTDITRTILLGDVANLYPEAKLHYNLVKKSLESLSNLHFPRGVTGAHLDAIARQNLWNCGLNYNHGTGHGVGSFLSVHEGPCGISPRSFGTKLEVGMVLSIEPGVYFDGKYGIRLENLVVVQPSNRYENFLMFETLTDVEFEEY